MSNPFKNNCYIDIYNKPRFNFRLHVYSNYLVITSVYLINHICQSKAIWHITVIDLCLCKLKQYVFVIECNVFFGTFYLIYTTLNYRNIYISSVNYMYIVLFFIFWILLISLISQRVSEIICHT